MTSMGQGLLLVPGRRSLLALLHAWPALGPVTDREQLVRCEWSHNNSESNARGWHKYNCRYWNRPRRPYSHELSQFPRPVTIASVPVAAPPRQSHFLVFTGLNSLIRLRPSDSLAELRIRRVRLINSHAPGARVYCLPPWGPFLDCPQARKEQACPRQKIVKWSKKRSKL